MPILDALVKQLGKDVVSGPDAIDAAYLGDWLLKLEGGQLPAALVRPRTTQEVSATLKVCHAQGVPVVAQGGRTGLTGGATPAAGWVVLSLERMRAVECIDSAGATATVQAGAPLQSVQEAADTADLLFPLDIGSRGTCTIGGNISTNAGGNRVLRFGMMRELVLGLEVVLADGTVVESLNTMLKNNAGYDLKQMFIGSEGTLGVITRAVLRLFPKPRSLQTAICAVRDYDGGVELLGRMKAGLGASLSAFEMMWPDFYFLGTDLNKRRAPVAHGAGAYILVEAMGVNEERDAETFSLAIGEAHESGIVTDAVVAQSRKESSDFWAIRDAPGEFPKLFWPFVGFDVSLPVARIGEFVAECTRRLDARWPQTKHLYFGHIADSNIHICVQTADRPMPDAEIDELVYEAVREFKGSVSAEHGIGILKRPYLGFTRGPVELALMKRLKASLDPTGILNPQKVFQ